MNQFPNWHIEMCDVLWSFCSTAMSLDHQIILCALNVVSCTQKHMIKYYICDWILTLHIKCVTWDELYWGKKVSLASPQMSWCLFSWYTYKSIVQYIFNSLCFVKGALTLMEHLKPQRLQLQWRQLLLLSPEIKIYLLKKVILSLLLQWIIGVAVLWVGGKGQYGSI